MPGPDCVVSICFIMYLFFVWLKLKDNGKVKFIGITGYPLENFRSV